MSTLIVPNRRGFITGLIGLVAAPAIVKITSLMPVVPIVDLDAIYDEIIAGEQIGGNCLLTINMITRQAIEMWAYNNTFIQNINADGKIGTQLRIKLPGAQPDANI